MTRGITYSDAGVDIDRANVATARIKELARRTFNERTLSDIGSFGGMFDAAFPDLRNPVLVASADGVGTKLKIAFAANVHNTIGKDLVNHCVNDILVQGARPLFFLDYIATGALAPDTVAKIVEGLASACEENGCVLLGGETAEMPGFYSEGEYDVAGFIVGCVDRQKIINGSRIVEGDVVIGLASNGLHTNGYSLARKLFLEVAGHDVRDVIPELGSTLRDALLQTHVSYLKSIDGLLDTGLIKGLAHITGGGLVENIPRILPEGIGVSISPGAWPVLPIFELMQRIGEVPVEEMYRTFNMGIGMVIVCAVDDVPRITSHVGDKGQASYQIGVTVKGSGTALVRQT